MAANTNAGKIRWSGVRDHMKQNNDRILGMLQLQAKWEQLQTLRSPFDMAILDSVKPIVQGRKRKSEDGQ